MAVVMVKSTEAVKLIRNYLLLLIAVAMFFSCATEAYPRVCAFNRGNAVDNVKKCTYGWEMDACGNKICTKGMLLAS